MQDLPTGNISSYLRTSRPLRFAQATLGRVKSLFLGTRISSYFERRKAERKQFERDKMMLMLSIRFNPNNWTYTEHPIPYGGHVLFDCFQIVNSAENMMVWMANGYWGLHFTVEDRYYGGVAMWGNYSPWRREVLNQARRAIETDWIKPR